MENPIIGNRIVNDKTFARRLVSHLKETSAGCAMGEDELGYLLRVAKKLLQFQLYNCPEDEKPYHLNCDKTLTFATVKNKVLNYANLIDENKMYPVTYTIKQNGDRVIQNTTIKGGYMTENQIKEYLLKEFYETLKGLVSDISDLLVENDIEWQQAGYFEHAKELLKNEKRNTK